MALHQAIDMLIRFRYSAEKVLYVFDWEQVYDKQWEIDGKK